MKLFAILTFTTLWLIHIRVSGALATKHYRLAGHGPPYRRAHHPAANPLSKPPMTNGLYRKKWFSPQLQQQQLLQQHQRPRRPSMPPAAAAPAIAAFMRQRTGVPNASTPPLPMPATKPSNTASTRKPLHVKSPKPFQSSPKIHSEMEYQIHTNQIPNNQPVFIKQMDDEKGPIHTIPAPNLSPADKPKQIFIERPQHYESSTYRVLKPQYQVSEVSPDKDALQPEAAGESKEEQAPFRLLPLQEGFTYSILHQPQLQQHLLQQQQSPSYQTMVVQPQFFQAQHKHASSTPEMLSFNYEEPRDGPQQQQHLQVSSQYSLEGAATTNDDVEAGAKQNTHEQSLSVRKAAEMMIYVPDEVDQLDASEDVHHFAVEPKPTPMALKKFNYGNRIRPKIS